MADCPVWTETKDVAETLMPSPAVKRIGNGLHFGRTSLAPSGSPTLGESSQEDFPLAKWLAHMPCNSHLATDIYTFA